MGARPGSQKLLTLILPDISGDPHYEHTTIEGSPTCSSLSDRLPVLQDTSTVCISTPDSREIPVWLVLARRLDLVLVAHSDLIRLPDRDLVH